jgi:hypothetical protein
MLDQGSITEGDRYRIDQGSRTEGDSYRIDQGRITEEVEKGVIR